MVTKNINLQEFKSLTKQIIKEELNLNEQDNNLFKFGKYKGKTLEDVFNENPSYIRWVVDTVLPKTPEQIDFINKAKEILSSDKDVSQVKQKSNKTNVKTIKIYIPDQGALKILKTTPVFNTWVRSDLKVGDNIERVNHVQFHNIATKYPWVEGVTVEDITNINEGIMKKKKITLKEFKELVKNIIKEEIKPTSPSKEDFRTPKINPNVSSFQSLDKPKYGTHYSELSPEEKEEYDKNFDKKYTKYEKNEYYQLMDYLDKVRSGEINDKKVKFKYNPKSIRTFKEM